jgi:hypothetical protein
MLFLVSWVGLAVATRRGWLALSPERACLVTFLAFHVLYGSLSAQYLLWVVPFGVLWPGRMLAAHAAGATAGLVGFYLFLAPGVLLPQPLEGPAAVGAGRLWVLGVGVTLVVSAAWLGELLRDGVRAARGRVAHAG